MLAGCCVFNNRRTTHHEKKERTTSGGDLAEAWVEALKYIIVPALRQGQKLIQ